MVATFCLNQKDLIVDTLALVINCSFRVWCVNRSISPSEEVNSVSHWNLVSYLGVLIGCQLWDGVGKETFRSISNRLEKVTRHTFSGLITQLASCTQWCLSWRDNFSCLQIFLGKYIFSISSECQTCVHWKLAWPNLKCHKSNFSALASGFDVFHLLQTGKYIIFCLIE